MPIIGLTDQLTHEMPRLGQLRKGAKKPQNSKKPGKDLTYFRFVCHNPDIVARFEKVYGKEPRLINCRLAFPDLERSFPTWREEWGAGSLKHRCDGETMTLWQDEEGLYHTQPEPCPYADLPDKDPGRKCKQSGLLRIIIDDLGEWAYVDAVTTGQWDCIQLTENVLEVEYMAKLASDITGRAIGIQGIPCQLKREPRMTSCPNFNGDGPRQRQEKWMLYLYVHPDYLKSLREEMSRYSLPVVDLPQLEAPTTDLEVDYHVSNGDEPVEYPETEVVDEPEPATNGKKVYYKPDFIARIKELMAEAESLEAPKNYDQSVLDEADMAELKRIGAELREHIETVKAAKTEQAKMELEAV